jgi:UDP-N-acetylglucosamine 2-epimerase (non-hydrolysing)
LVLGLDIIKSQGEEIYFDFFKDIDFSKRIILITAHSRESFGTPFINICEAIKEIAITYLDVELVYQVHLNPNVQQIVNEVLTDIENIHLIKPIEYPYLIWLMNKSFMVLTDSGGIQEEAPTLGKPVLVLREVTERQEVVDAGTAKLVGTDKELIITETKKLLDNHSEYSKMANAVNPYADGKTAERILSIYMNGSGKNNFTINNSTRLCKV